MRNMNLNGGDPYLYSDDEVTNHLLSLLRDSHNFS